MAKQPRQRRIILGDAVPVIGILVGLAMLAAPVIVDIIEQHHARNTVMSASAAVQGIDPARKELLLQNAHAYNEQLFSHERSSLDVLPYDDQLSYDGSSMMGYIEIPKISITLPIYHHADDMELSDGAGHVEGTSLPVGGESTHTVISAHSGMPSARMFDDIGSLETGDRFTVRILGETLAYQVVEIRIIEPEEIESVGIQENRDLCTLMTCTPYGVNSHRLLVTGERCEYVPEVTPAVYIAPRAYPLIWALMAVGLTLTVLSAWRLLAGRRRRRAELHGSI